jgi:hypothetical protein
MAQNWHCSPAHSAATGRHRSLRMVAQREVFGDPRHLPGIDKALIDHRLRRQGMALAGRALKIPKLHHYQLGRGVAIVRVPRDRKPGVLRVWRQALRCSPQWQLGLFSRLRLLGLRWFLAAQQCVKPAGKGLHGLRADQRISLAARVVHELEAGRPRKAQGLPRRQTVLHPHVGAARGQTLLVGRHVGADVMGDLGQEAGGIRQAVPLRLGLKERVVHRPEAGRPLLGHTQGRRCPPRRRGMQRGEGEIVKDELHLLGAAVSLQQGWQGLAKVPRTEGTEIVTVLDQGQRGVRMPPKGIAARREPNWGALIRVDSRDLMVARWALCSRLSRGDGLIIDRG